MRKTIVENYAKRLHSKLDLKLPVDLELIANSYAELRYVDIPLNIDGVTAHLKVRGKKPVILVNREKPPQRKRFTLAHEIGHVIIPWHTGTIFDIADANESIADSGIDYWEMEREANAFATELLMPEKWVHEIISKNDDLAKIHELISKNAEVSPIAACLRLISFLPSGVIFAATDLQGLVKYSGRSNDTMSTAPTKGSHLEVQRDYPFCKDRYEFKTQSMFYHWLKLPTKIALPKLGEREWRVILDEIFDDLDLEKARVTKLKQQLNGVLGFANGSVKRGEYTKDSLYSACLQRFSSAERLFIITKHDLFPEFLSAKIRDIFKE